MGFCTVCNQPFKGSGPKCSICDELHKHEEQIRNSVSWIDIDPSDYICDNCEKSDWVIRLYPDNGSITQVELVCRTCGTSDNEPDIRTTYPIL
jgi:hypothetical protein